MFDHKANVFPFFCSLLLAFRFPFTQAHTFFFPRFFSFIQPSFRAYPLKGCYSNWWDKSGKEKSESIYIYIYVLCALIVREKNGDNDYLFAAINPGFLPHVLPQPNTYVECVILNAANDNEICTLTQRQPHIAPTQTHSAYSFTSAHIHHANIVNKQQKGCST